MADASTTNLAGAPREELVAFVHIPKTAGGTTITMLTNAFGRRGVRDVGNYYTGEERTVTKVQRAFSRREGARIFVGHVPIGVFRRILPDGTPYVTLLRDPLERVLSHYYRHIGAPRRAGSTKPAKQTLEEVLGLRRPEVSNLQTRMLCNDPDLPDRLPPEALDQAKANLDTMAFVGVQERFNESVVLLERALGIDAVVPYPRSRHVGGARPSVGDLTAGERALIEDVNAYDLELYEYGRVLFEKTVAAAGDGLDDDVETLRVQSASASAEAEAETAAATEWLLEQLPPGTIRPIEEIMAAATRDSIPYDAVTRARQQLRVRQKGVDAQGRELWKLRAPGAKEAKRLAKAGREPDDDD